MPSYSFEKESKRLLKPIKIILTTSVIVLLAIIIPLLVVLILNYKRGPLGIIISLTYFVLMLIFDVLLFLRLLIYKKRIISYLRDLRDQQNILGLLAILKGEDQKWAKQYPHRRLACLLLVEFDPAKALSYLSRIIERDFENKVYTTDYLSMLKFFPAEEYKKMLFESLFEAITLAQLDYTSSQKDYVLRPSEYNTYTTTLSPLNRQSKSALTTIATALGYQSVATLIKTVIYTQLANHAHEFKAEKTLTIEQLLKLCRIGDEDFLRKAINDLLIMYPSLGYYNEIEQTFTPSAEFKNFKTIVDIDMVTTKGI